ncbi:type VII secretion-associated serine protease mycosin [Streptomyces finlayi]|uniref:Type VII secretion-associated serine protease mycosin n=1 Tax=Streptomyces finlayi TaxID=67296 RepID=A0A7G7BNY6_9ACTN|nr:type VII secretion-associated serine protease mycosin [Streptomyces finlayi]QNE77051.1 type VII secretion-associated serine protease mycosin [Streptomyces finlayi]
MRISRNVNWGAARPGTVASVVLGLLLIGAVPARADSVRSDQWHLDSMQAEEMWETSTGENVTVAVIDSGVDPSNPDLLGQVLKGKDLALTSPGDEHVDYDGHGTGMAGLIAGTGQSGGGDGAFGLAPGAKILPIRMTDDTGKVNGATGSKNFNDDLTKGIRYAADNGAKVINVSSGDLVGSPQLADAVKYALQKGSLIFAAVGNTAESGNPMRYPAGTPGVVGVASVGRDGKRADYSQYGTQVDLAAPGVDMVQACGGKTGLCKTTGTSDASAIASASAALIWSQHPDWTNNQVLRVLLNTAGGPNNGAERTDYVGHGIVRPRIALKTPGDPGPADVYPLPDLAAAESAKPSAKPTPTKGGSEADEDETPAVAAPATDDESGNAALWIGLGVGAAALIGGAVAVAAARSRRRTAAPTPPPYQQAPHPAYAPPHGTPGARPPYGGPPSQDPRV